MYMFSVYATSTGQFLRVCTTCDDTLNPADLSAGESYVSGRFMGSDHYVEDNEVLPRPVLQPMAGAIYDLSSLPAGAKLVVTDPVGVVTEVPAQEDTLELIDAGAWRVRSVSPFPHVDFDVEVLI